MGPTVQLAVFELDNRDYGVPLARVARVVRAVDVTPLPRAPAVVLGVVDLHGAILPVISVRRCLGIPAVSIGLHDQFMIVRTFYRTVALVVDRVREIVTYPIDEITPSVDVLPRWNEIQGIAQLAGGLILIQDLDRFLSLQEDQALQAALEGQDAD